jgi:lambda family phage portal protein
MARQKVKTEALAADVVKRRPRRLYEGARLSRLTSDWVTSSTSADAEINASLVLLRNRARQLVRDNDYARQALRLIRNNVVGSGIKLQAQVPMSRGSSRLNQAVNDQIEEAWVEWGRAKRCHTGGRLGWIDLQRMVIGAIAESGEVFIRLVPQPFGDSRVPLALEVLEADLCDETYESRPQQGHEWRMGVEVDQWGRPTRYAFRTRHPGDIRHGTSHEVKLVPANQILHLAILDRPHQTRGVPWLASTIKRLHHLAGYEEAEVVRARAASSLMGFITSPEGELVGDEVYDAERVSNFEPGVFKYLAPGESVSVPQLDAPDGQFPDFMRAMLQGMSAGIGISYAPLSQDYSQSNYSSSRLSLIDDRENWKVLQQYLIDNFITPVYEAWLDAAVRSGVLRLAGYESMPERFRRARWMCRGWAWVDPVKEVMAYKDAVRSGFATQSQIVSELGGDLEELMLQRQQEVERASQLGLSFDTDPAQDADAQRLEAEGVSIASEQDAEDDGTA